MFGVFKWPSTSFYMQHFYLIHKKHESLWLKIIYACQVIHAFNLFKFKHLHWYIGLWLTFILDANSILCVCVVKECAAFNTIYNTRTLLLTVMQPQYCSVSSLKPSYRHGAWYPGCVHFFSAQHLITLSSHSLIVIKYVIAIASVPSQNQNLSSGEI